MKILIDARFYGLENSGLGRYTINLIDQLQRLDKTNQYFILLRKKYFEELKLNNNFEKVLADIKHYSLKEQIEMPKIISKYNPDLTHFLHFNMPFNFRGKFVATIHDMTMHTQKTNASSLFLPAYLIKHTAYKKVFGRAIEKSEKIIVPSQFVKEEVVKYFNLENTKVKVIYEGISILSSPKNFENPPQMPYFLYAGNAYPHKNLEKAIRAFAELKVNFYIVSKENKFTDRLKRLVSKLNAQEFIKFLGYVSDENLKMLYEKSVGFIYPSLVEGFGLQGLEAMNCGTILLCSSIPVFKEIYGSHAVYFDPNDIESIENAIHKTLGFKKTEADKMIKENKIFIKRYSWEKMARETLEVYKECYTKL